MKKLIIIACFLILASNLNNAQPRGKDFGFGIILGEPTGLTLKYWPTSDNAWVFDVGASYFGKLRIGADYLWHFDAFNSRIVELYAGPGAAIGIGEGKGFWYKGKYVREESEIGIGMRGVFGVNVIPENTPLEIFLELGLLVALTPDFGSSADAAIGFRFYP